MRTLITSFILFLIVAPGRTISQTKPVEKAVISVPGAQDEACKERIENYLRREDGIISSNLNYHRRTLTVKWYTDRTNIENIKTAVANLGYDAGDVKANPEAYYRLPVTCRHVPLDTNNKSDSTQRN